MPNFYQMFLSVCFVQNLKLWFPKLLHDIDALDACGDILVLALGFLFFHGLVSTNIAVYSWVSCYVINLSRGQL